MRNRQKRQRLGTRAVGRERERKMIESHDIFIKAAVRGCVGARSADQSVEVWAACCVMAARIVSYAVNTRSSKARRRRETADPRTPL